MRLRSNKGNAFTIVIVALALFTIFLGATFMQLNNQIKSNKNTLENISSKYAAEAGIEEAALDVVNQIEEQVNSSTLGKSNLKYNQKVNDEFADVKNELMKAHEGLLELKNKYNIFDDNIKELNSIIANEYISAEILSDDINKIKWDIIQTLAIQNNTVKLEVKSSVYNIIGYINESNTILYNSKYMHRGSGHGAITPQIEDIGGNQMRVITSHATESFIDDGTNEYSYRIGSIHKYVITELTSSVANLQSSFNGWVGPVGSLNKLRNDNINTDLGNYLNTIRYSNPGGFNEFLYYQDYPDRYYIKLEQIKKSICNNIDISINKYLIKDVENELYRIYVEEFEEKDRTPEKIELLKEVLAKFEIAKKNLIELKCKLGYVSSDTSGEIIPLSVDTDTKGELYIEVKEFKNLLDDNYSYVVQKIDKTPINVIYTSNKISRVENLELEIVSTGNVQGKKYKRKATVLFTTTKEGDKFITDYTIKSYDKIKNK